MSTDKGTLTVDREALVRKRQACHILLPGVTVAPESQWRTAS